jgi:hypothetical protein
LLIIGLLSSLAAGLAQADMNGGRASPAARYEVERAACLRGQSAQHVDTCLREAGATLAQARRGARQDDPSQLEINRLQRCQPLPDPLRRDCIARVQGEGKVTGSVAEGGILRELVTEIEQAETDSADALR